jgi:putative ABC transport system permease protein
MLSTLGAWVRQQLRARPGYAAAVVVSVALAVAANTALFTVVHAVLLRQLPFPDADRLLWIWNRRVDRDRAFFSLPEFLDYREQARTLDGIAAWANWGVNLQGPDQTERVTGLVVTGDCFELLGSTAALGRTLSASDARPDAPKVVVITHGLWKRRFGADPGMVGRTLLLNGQAYQLAGVLPPEFFFPAADAELAAPLVAETHPRREDRQTNFLRVFARRASGSGVAQVEAELAAIATRLRQLHPDSHAKKIPPRAVELHREVVGDHRQALLLLWAAVTVILLIACANLAGLFLAQCAARQHELAVRAALGASRGRLLRQLVGESVLLALAGGLLGFALAASGTRLVLSLAPSGLPRLGEVGVNATVLGFSIAISLLVGALFGLAPALQFGRGVETLRVLHSRGIGSRSGTRSRRALVVGQVALALLLSVLALGLRESFRRVEAVDPGFRAERLLLLRLSLPAASYGSPGQVGAFVDALLRAVGSDRGVEGVAVANATPLSGSNVRSDFSIVGRPAASPDEEPGAQSRRVSHGYFETLGIPILGGRGIEPRDTAATQGVVVVDRALARAYFGDEDPVGRHLRIENHELEVVGVVGDVKHFGLEETPLPTLYRPVLQLTAVEAEFFASGFALAVRTRAEPLALAASLRRSVLALDPAIAASGAKTMGDRLDLALSARRFNTQLLLAFAVAAVGLSGLGLFALMTYTVRQAQRDIGLRLALGATPRQIVRRVVGEGGRLAGLGLLLGLPLTLGAASLASSLFFEVRPAEPSALLLGAVVMVTVLLAASLIPAWRAARTDPCATLRES